MMILFILGVAYGLKETLGFEEAGTRRAGLLVISVGS